MYKSRAVLHINADVRIADKTVKNNDYHGSFTDFSIFHLGHNTFGTIYIELYPMWTVYLQKETRVLGMFLVLILISALLTFNSSTYLIIQCIKKIKCLNLKVNCHFSIMK